MHFTNQNFFGKIDKGRQKWTETPIFIDLNHVIVTILNKVMVK